MIRTIDEILNEYMTWAIKSGYDDLSYTQTKIELIDKENTWIKKTLSEKFFDDEYTTKTDTYFFITELANLELEFDKENKMVILKYKEKELSSISVDENSEIEEEIIEEPTEPELPEEPEIPEEPEEEP